MGKVTHTSNEPIQELYNQVAMLKKLVRRVSGKTPRIPIQSGTGTPFTLNENDGSVWIDIDDGTLHWVVGGVEWQITGTQV